MYSYVRVRTLYNIYFDTFRNFKMICCQAHFACHSTYCTNMFIFFTTIYSYIPLLGIGAVWKLCRGESLMGEARAEHCREVILTMELLSERCWEKIPKKKLRVERYHVEILEEQVEYCLHCCGERSERAAAAEHCFGQRCFDERPAVVAVREERSGGGCS